MTLAVYTFADEGYVPALAGLINSLRHQGFQGKIHVGSPEQLSIGGQLGEDIAIHVMGANGYWPGNRKAELLLAHPSERFVFFDADIIVSDPTFLSRMNDWLSISPVFSVEAIISSVDYRRHMWAKRLGRSPRSSKWPCHYFNSGLFGGIMERDRPILQAWDLAIHSLLAPPGAVLSDIDFPFSDQDVLNAVLQDWEPQPIGIGPPDICTAGSPLNSFFHMGTFKRAAVIHCTGQQKPWKVNHVPSRTPSAYDLAWYEHAVAEPRPIQTKIIFSLPVRSWFEQRRWLRFVSLARKIRRRAFGA
jgi:hypothetical protein